MTGIKAHFQKLQREEADFILCKKVVTNTVDFKLNGMGIAL